jgi:hypothetical protein
VGALWSCHLAAGPLMRYERGTVEPELYQYLYSEMGDEVIRLSDAAQVLAERSIYLLTELGKSNPVLLKKLIREASRGIRL